MERQTYLYHRAMCAWRELMLLIAEHPVIRDGFDYHYMMNLVSGLCMTSDFINNGNALFTLDELEGKIVTIEDYLVRVQQAERGKILSV